MFEDVEEGRKEYLRILGDSPLINSHHIFEKKVRKLLRVRDFEGAGDCEGYFGALTKTVLTLIELATLAKDSMLDWICGPLFS